MKATALAVSVSASPVFPVESEWQSQYLIGACFVQGNLLVRQ